MSTYRLRWRADATGFVASFAGQWASSRTFTRDEAEGLKRAAVNGDQIEIVEVRP